LFITKHSASEFSDLESQVGITIKSCLFLVLAIELPFCISLWFGNNAVGGDGKAS
jgi:hypothetical protein